MSIMNSKLIKKFKYDKVRFAKDEEYKQEVLMTLAIIRSF